jgi:hypothetical protein
MTDDVEMSRRDFVKVAGASAVTAMVGSAAAQTTTNAEAAGVLVGPEEGRPSADSEFFADYDTYSFVHIADDTGVRAHITHEQTGWKQLPPCIVEKNGSLYHRKEV